MNSNGIPSRLPTHVRTVPVARYLIKVHCFVSKSSDDTASAMISVHRVYEGRRKKKSGSENLRIREQEVTITKKDLIRKGVTAEIKGKHKDVNERNFEEKKNTWEDKGWYEKNTSNKVIKLENDLWY